MKNQAEQLVLAIEKTISESGDKLSEEDKNALNDAAKTAKEKLASADDVDSVKAITEELSKVANPIFTKLYQDAQAQEGQNGGADDDTTINVNPDDIN